MADEKSLYCNTLLMSIMVCSGMNTALNLGLPISSPCWSCYPAAQKHSVTGCHLEFCFHSSTKYLGDRMSSFLLMLSEWGEGPGGLEPSRKA